MAIRSNANRFEKELTYIAILGSSTNSCMEKIETTSFVRKKLVPKYEIRKKTDMNFPVTNNDAGRIALLSAFLSSFDICGSN